MTASSLAAIPGVLHAFGTALPAERGGRHADSEPLAPLIPQRTQLITLEQVHGAAVALVNCGKPEAVDGVDAAVTATPGLALAIRTADCIPILFAARTGKAVAAAHAGWRGLLEGIIPNTVRRLKQLTGVEAGELACALGPAIGPCCYEFSRDLFSRFLARYAENAQAAWHERNGKGYLDLRKLALEQLTSAGVPPQNIRMVGGCTCCEADRFCSYRRDGAKAGRQISWVLRRP